MIHLYTHVVPHIIAWAPRPSASGLPPARLCRALSHNVVTRTLAQNCHCEFCCGARLTCKNNPVTPDRNRSVFGVE